MRRCAAGTFLTLSWTVVGMALLLGGLKAFALTEGDYTYNVTEDGKAIITGFVPSRGGALTIPGTLGGFPVTIIDYGVFADQPGLTSVVIPESVTGIGGAAFSGCASLASVSIPDSVTSISDNLFTECPSLAQVNIPAGVTYIGVSAFANCVRLTHVTLPGQLATLAGGAFQGCAGLSGSISIPAEVTYIAYDAFMGCTKLAAINVDQANACYRSVEGVLYDAGLTTLIQCPAGHKGISVASVRSTRPSPRPAGKLGSYAIPSGVTTIMLYAFAGCARLTDVTIPEGLVTIDWGAFSDCTGLTNLSIPSSVNRVDSCAFWGCSGLSSVTLAEGTYGIEALAFCYCTGLTRVTIPASVSGIGGWAFGDCTGLKGLYFKGALPGTISDIWGDESGVAAPPCCYYLAGAAGWGATFAGCPTAVWTTTATFNAMGGSASFVTRTYNVGAAYGELPVAERSGYVFSGWWTKPSGLGEPVVEAKLVPYLYTGHTLYAKWAPVRTRGKG